MTQRLPKLWWDVVLDGGTYHVDLDATQFSSLTALRSAAYREAELRHRLVATHKVGVDSLVIQAWGTPELASSAPNLLHVTAEPAPTVAAALPRKRTYTCDCGQGPISHPLTCSLWGAPKIKPRPAVAQPPRPAPDPWEQVHMSADSTPTPEVEAVEPDDEALLGPCTCGHAPVCLPDCLRVAGA